MANSGVAFMASVAPMACSAPTSVRLARSSDTGISSSDGLTKVRNPEIIWEAAKGGDVVDVELAAEDLDPFARAEAGAVQAPQVASHGVIPDDA